MDGHKNHGDQRDCAPDLGGLGFLLGKTLQSIEAKIDTLNRKVDRLISGAAADLKAEADQLAAELAEHRTELGSALDAAPKTTTP